MLRIFSLPTHSGWDELLKRQNGKQMKNNKCFKIFYKIALKINWTLILTAALTFWGWNKVNNLNIERDRENKKLEVQINYLINVYRILALSSNRPFEEMLISRIAIEQAVADLQLFGSIYQVEKTRDFCKELTEKINKNDKSSIESQDKLILSLRKDLRKYLKLEEIKDDEAGVFWLRISPNPKIDQQQKNQKDN